MKTQENTPKNKSQTPSTGDANELATLRTHNAELLADLKIAKARVSSLQSELEAANSAKDAAVKELHTLKLDHPVNALLEEIAMPGMAPALAKMIAARGYTFELDNNEIVIKDADGNRATVMDKTKANADNSQPKATKREANFDAADVRHLLLEDTLPEAERNQLSQAFSSFLLGSQANGGGAVGSSRGIQAHDAKENNEIASKAPRFQLS